MRAQLMPGEDPLTVPAPEEVAPRVADLCMPDWSETGKLYDVKTQSVKRFQPPC